MLVKLNIDNNRYLTKPSKEEVGKIQKRIGSCTTELSIQELTEAICNGRTFKAGALNGAKNVDWVSQQIFAIDVDNDEKTVAKYGILTADKVIERCKKYNVFPSFFYYSFSHAEDLPKFRVVFTLPLATDDIRVRNAVQIALMTIFPESDKACKDLSRCFYGTNKEYIPYENMECTIEPYHLIQSMVAYIKDTDVNNHANREISKYCKAVGLNMINNLPHVKLDIADLEDLDIFLNAKVGENSITLINNNISLMEKSPILKENIVVYKKSSKLFSTISIFNFNVDVDNAYKVTIDNDNKKNYAKYEVDNIKYTPTNEVIQKFDFEELENNCQLYREFADGSRWCYHSEVFGIATNLWRAEGAQIRFTETIVNNDDYIDKANKINTIKSCASYAYAPMSCDSFCPYKDTCTRNGANMLAQVMNKAQVMRRVDTSTSTLKTAQELDTELPDTFYNEILPSGYDGGIIVLKSDTGSGKSYLLENMPAKYYKNTVIAAPTHRLLKELYDRLKTKCKDILYMQELEIEDEAVRAEYNKFEKIGAYAKANKVLKQYEADLRANNKIAKAQEVKRFLENKNKFATHKGLTLCTHKRYINAQRAWDLAIIDEDIVKSSCISIKELDYDDIINIRIIASNQKANVVKSIADTIISAVQDADNNVDFAQQIQIRAVDSFNEIGNFINRNASAISTNIKELANIKAVLRNHNNKLYAVSYQPLPIGKTIIMSATANEKIYKRLFETSNTAKKYTQPVHFYDLSGIQGQGKVIIHPIACSRSTMQNKLTEILDKVKQESPTINNIITFARYENDFKKAGYNTIAHFGATEGIDSYKGQDLAVVGVPHLNNTVYLLYAVLLDLADGVSCIDKAVYKKVQRNGYEFYFNIVNASSVDIQSELQREIQFYLIESELAQAVGRARVLRTPATVHVYGNLPLQNFEIYKK